MPRRRDAPRALRSNWESPRRTSPPKLLNSRLEMECIAKAAGGWRSAEDGAVIRVARIIQEHAVLQVVARPIRDHVLSKTVGRQAHNVESSL